MASRVYVKSAVWEPQEGEVREPAGVARVLEGVWLLSRACPMNEPVTQEAPLMTQDMLQEQSEALAAIGAPFETQSETNIIWHLFWITISNLITPFRRQKFIS